MRSIFVTGFLMSCVGAVAGAAETPGRDTSWADGEVRPILSKVERASFKALRSDEQREAFVRDFWKGLDPIPLTPNNELKEEYYQRVEYVREHFGMASDRGRAWLLLGRPNQISTKSMNVLRQPAVVWHYFRLRYRSLPTYLALYFYKPHGSGDYELYSPLHEGLLATSTPPLPGAESKIGLRVPPTLWGMHELDLANPAESHGLFPMLDRGRIEDSILMNGSELIRETVRASVKTHVALKGEATLPLAVSPAARAGADGVADVEVTTRLAPEGITFEEIKKTYYARIDLSIRLTTASGQSVSEMQESLPIRLTREELEEQKTYSLRHVCSLPAIPGRYTVDVIALDYASSRAGRVEQQIDVSAGALATPSAADVGGAFAFEAAQRSPSTRQAIIGLEHLHAGNLVEAEAAFRRSLEADASDIEQRMNLARVLVKLERFEEAASVLQPLYENDRSNLDGLMVRSVALVRSGRPDAGRESVEEIVRLFPESVKALNYCAGSLLELGDTARARALFEQSLGLEPDQPEVAAQLRVWRE